MSAEHDRLDALEVALAHAEATLLDLSDVAAAQGRDIEALRAENLRLKRHIERVEERLDEEGEFGNGFVP